MAQQPVSKHPPVGSLLRVGNRRLFVHRSGAGKPVVFLAGAGTVGLDYFNVQQGAARLATSVLYDRGGTGFSDRVKLPRTADEVIDELRALMKTAGLAGRYILAGHSLGGLYARRFAQRFPDEVSGLVLLDPAHEDYDAYMPQKPGDKRAGGKQESADEKKMNKTLMPPLLAAVLSGAVANGLTRSLLSVLPPIPRYRALYRKLFTQAYAGWPGDIRDLLVERHVSLEWLLGGMMEAQNVNELYDSMRGAPMPDVPMIILCSNEIDEFRKAVAGAVPGDVEKQELDGKQRLYETLARSVSRGEVRLVQGGHVTMHFRHPEAVVDAIKDVLATAL